jgi:hypothetical protein
MNKEKRKALAILSIFVLIVIVFPFSSVIILKPSGENLNVFVNLIGGLSIFFIGALGIYAGCKIKLKK